MLIFKAERRQGDWEQLLLLFSPGFQKKRIENAPTNK
jgi:hypothetical protein